VIARWSRGEFSGWTLDLVWKHVPAVMSRKRTVVRLRERLDHKATFAQLEYVVARSRRRIFDRSQSIGAGLDQLAERVLNAAGESEDLLDTSG
jgi:hypothetical protein